MSEQREGWQELIDRRCDSEIDDATWMALVDRHGPELGRALKRERAIRRALAEGERPAMPDGLRRAILAEVANTPQIDTETVSREKEATTRARRRHEEEARGREPGGKVIPWVVVTGGLLAAGLSLAVIPGLWNDGGTRGGDTAAPDFAYDDTGAAESMAGAGSERGDEDDPGELRGGKELLSELEEETGAEGERKIARKGEGSLGTGDLAVEKDASSVDATAPEAASGVPAEPAGSPSATPEEIPPDELQALVAQAQAFARERRAAEVPSDDGAAKNRTEDAEGDSREVLPLDFRVHSELEEGRLTLTSLTVVNHGEEPLSIDAERLVLFGLDRDGEIAYHLATPLARDEPLAPGGKLEVAVDRAVPPDERVRYLVIFLGERRTEPMRWAPPTEAGE